MPMIFYTDADGNQSQAEVPIGQSVMQGAVDNDIDGILAECGACVCATCHSILMRPGGNGMVPRTVLNKKCSAMCMSPNPIAA